MKSGGNDNCISINICPDIIIAGLVAAGVAGFFLLNMAITVAAGRRRKKRNSIHLEQNILTFFEKKFYLGKLHLYYTVIPYNTRGLNS